jgi:YVTN family beta-propeller protein
MRGPALAARFAALALAGLALLAGGAAVGAEPAYPLDAAAVTTLTLEPDGSQPVALASNPRTGRIYVANAGSDNVSVIDAASSTVVATISVDSAPHAVGVDADANRVYVTNSGSNEVTVIDGDSNAVVATLPVGKQPWDVAVDPNTGRVFVTNRSSGTLSVIDGRHSLLLRTVSMGDLPTGVAVNPDTGRVYVAGSGSGQLVVVDAVSNLLIGTLPVSAQASGDAWDVAVDSSSNRVYVAVPAAEASDADAGAVLVVDASSDRFLDSIAVPGPAETLAVDPASGRLYVGGSSDSRLWVIDTGTGVVTSAVSLEAGLSALDVDPVSGRVQAAHADTASLSLVSWMPGVTLAPGWTYACYFGEEQSLDDALGTARDSVLAVYRPGPSGYDRWFPDNSELSTISTVRSGEALFVLASGYAAWAQEPSEASSDFSVAPGWSSICYSGESEEASLAVGGMSEEIAVSYGLAADGTWRRFVPTRPDLSTMSYVRSFSPLIVLIPTQEALPEPEAPLVEVSEEFLALQAVLENKVRSYYGDVAVCVTDLQTGERICVNGDAPHRTGCTINIFSLFVAMEEFMAGRARPEDWAYWIKIGIGHSSPPQVAVFIQGIVGSLEEGARRADELMHRWGMKDSLFAHLPGYPGQDPRTNILTASETNMILARLYRGELFPPEWTAYAIDRLLDIKPGLNYVLPLFLPAGTRVAHKIGYYMDWDGWVYNDVGIVMTVQGDKQIAYVISYLSQGMPSEYAGYITGAELSKTVYDWFDQRY